MTESPHRPRRPGRLGILSALLAALLSPPARALHDSPRFTRLTRDDGLSQSTVTAIAQDSLGFLWFGTQDGLNRYDGYTFKVYRRGPGGLPGSSIQDLEVDPDGNLWIATDGGLSHFDLQRERFDNYRYEPDDGDGLSQGQISSLFLASDGVLWVGTLGGGLDRFDLESGRFTHFDHDPTDPASLGHDVVNTVLGDADGRIWVGTEGGGLSRFDPATGGFTTFRHRPSDPASLSHDRVACLFRDRRANLWICTDNGLDRWVPPDRFAHYRPGDGSGLSHREVRAVSEDRSGTLWVGTKDGLNRLDPESGVFHSTRHRPADPTSLSDGFVRAIYEDRSGLLWIGTDGRGLNALDPTKAGFLTHRHIPGDDTSLASNMVWSLYEDRQGVLWVGTWGHGLHRFDAARDRFTRFVNRSPAVDPLAANIIHQMHEDRSGTFWLATDQGLYRFDRDTGRFTVFPYRPGDPPALSGGTNRSLLEDRDGILWVGTEQGLLALGPRRERIASYRHDPGDETSLSQDVVLVLFEDRAGNLLVGTEDGLNLLDRSTGRFRHYLTAPAPTAGVTSTFVRSIHEDRRGELWVGTSDGLHRLDRASGRSTVYREADGLPNSVIYGILEDSDVLWLSTNNGLSRFDPAAGTFRNYDKDDGLQDNEFNRGAYLRRADGQLLFGGINGLTAFYPSTIRDNTYVPPVVLTSFKRFNRETPLDRPISYVRRLTLPHDADVFSFEFAALDFHAPAKNRFAYRLQGLSTKWVDLGTKHDLTFTSLDPGPYVFRLRGSNNDGRWNEVGLAVKIDILPPFWGTLPFRMLVAVAAVVFLAAAYQLRTRSMRRHNLALQAEVAERRRAEDAQRRLNAALEARNLAFEQQQKELEVKNAELERYAYTVSHDLRSPLVTIKGYLDLLRRSFASGDHERFERQADIIADATSKMARLLEELLQLSRVGRVVSPPQPVSLSELANEAVELMAGRLHERGVAVSIDPAMPTVLADRVRLLEVFQNLLENAIKFMGQQPEPTIEIGGSQSNAKSLAYVRDNGIGIDSDYRERIFELFERLDKRVDGTGVGLALVKRIIENHGGRVWAESDGPGRGTTIWLSFPAPAEAAPEREGRGEI